MRMLMGFKSKTLLGGGRLMKNTVLKPKKCPVCNVYPPFSPRKVLHFLILRFFFVLGGVY